MKNPEMDEIVDKIKALMRATSALADEYGEAAGHAYSEIALAESAEAGKYWVPAAKQLEVVMRQADRAYGALASLFSVAVATKAAIDAMRNAKSAAYDSYCEIQAKCEEADQQEPAP